MLPLNRMFTRLPSLESGTHSHASIQYQHYNYRLQLTKETVRRLRLDYSKVLRHVRYEKHWTH